MEDLFDRAQNVAMLARLDRLTAATPAQWGKMNAGQMLAHCQVALEVALGKRALKKNLIGTILSALFAKAAKKKLLQPAPFDKNLPTAPDFKITDARTFATEHAKLRALIETFAQAGPAGLAKGPHPFFGPLTSPEWSALQWKHLDHHFRQFGV
ncbi:MAG: DUF1569 domain-containing protein [Planctomycetes bacterium]|nr:DUF1569 domain-containing protein [Planctomycetota bacterium]